MAEREDWSCPNRSVILLKPQSIEEKNRKAFVALHALHFGMSTGYLLSPPQRR
jgi:hypothetical protein